MPAYFQCINHHSDGAETYLGRPFCLASEIINQAPIIDFSKKANHVRFKSFYVVSVIMIVG
jgi:hypothetical protein